MKILVGLIDTSFVAAYFLLADYVGPNLVNLGMTWLWWLILLVLISSSYLVASGIPRFTNVQRRRGGRFVAIAYAFLLSTLFLYDFSLRLLLNRYCLGKVWIASLLLTLSTVVLAAWKSREEHR